MEWTNLNVQKPAAEGYYFTYYFNETYEKYFYKAIWWDGIGWVNWRWKPDGDRYIKIVEKVGEESRNDYYVPCMMWAKERLADARGKIIHE